MSTASARLEAFSDPERSGYKAVIQFLRQRRMQRRMEREQCVQTVKLPHRVSGQDLQRLEMEFGWKLEVVDRSPSMAPFAEAKTFCLSMVNKGLKSWDGEEVIIFDSDFMTLVVKNEGWVHCCCTYATSAKAAEYEQQLMSLTKAIEGKRLDISASAADFKQQFAFGQGQRVCRDAAKCTHSADTLLVDLPKVDVAAEQLARAMVQHQSTRAKVWFYFEPDMFVEDTGTLTSMQGRYLIDREADRVYIFPAGQTYVAYEYSFSSMMSYVLQSDVYVDGERFMLETHDSMAGVKFIQMTKALFEVPCDSEVDVHYYRESGEQMTVVEQMWTPPAMDGEGLDGKQVQGRIVIPTRICEKVVGRVMSAEEKKLTIDLARSAARDCVGQEVTKGSVVQKGRIYPAGTMEQLAQYAVKRAIKERAEMVIQQHAMTNRVKAARGSSNWVNCVVGSVLECGGDVVKAVLGLPSRLLGGFVVTQDFTFRDRPLEPALVVRNVVRAKSGDRFGSRVVGFFPGFKLSSSATESTTSSLDYVLYRARACKRSVAFGEQDVVASECENVIEHDGKDGFHSMSDQRDALVEKMSEKFDAHNLRVGYREEVKIDVMAPPDTTSVSMLADPVTSIMDDYRELLPVLDDVDTSVRTHLISATDREESFVAAKRVINREYDGLARDQRVRKSKLETVGGGSRVVTQPETILCFNKRVNNAPRVQLPTVIDKECDRHFSRFAEVCLRSDWRSIVAKRVGEGMWTSRLHELGKNVQKTDQTKVTRMLREAFQTGDINMTDWSAIVKPMPKPKVDESVAYEHGATQTILFQDSKMTNAYFSSMLSEFHDTLDEALRPNVCINVRRDVDNMEKWFNSFNPRRATLGRLCKSYEADIKQCDKSHTLFSWVVWLRVLQEFGLPDELCDLWSVMIGKKTASAPMVGMMIEFFEQLTSGGFHTISFNSIVCCVAVVNAMEFSADSLVTGQFVGDDSLLELANEVCIQDASNFLRDVYNLESKVFCSDIRYFCSRYYVEFDGYFFIMRDPGRLAESMGRHISAVADVAELWQAYVDTTRNYDKEELVQRLPFCYAQRMESRFIPTGLVRGLASLRDRDNFYNLYNAEIVEISA